MLNSKHHMQLGPDDLDSFPAVLYSYFVVRLGQLNNCANVNHTIISKAYIQELTR